MNLDSYDPAGSSNDCMDAEAYSTLYPFEYVRRSPLDLDSSLVQPFDIVLCSAY